MEDEMIFDLEELETEETLLIRDTRRAIFQEWSGLRSGTQRVWGDMGAYTSQLMKQDTGKQRVFSDEDVLLSYPSMYVKSNYVPGYYNRYAGRAPEVVERILDLEFDTVRARSCLKHPIELREEKLEVAEDDVQQDRVQLYMQELRLGKVGHMMDVGIYDTSDKHFRAIDTRVGELVSVMRSIPLDVVVHAPGDGVGACALASRVTGHVVVSSEPSPIGERAREIGLIQHKWTIQEHIEQYPKGFYLLSHLHRFVDIDQLVKDNNLEVLIFDRNFTRVANCEFVDEFSLIQTNSDRVKVVQYLVQPARLPDISTMAIEKMRSDDEYVAQHLCRMGKYDPQSKLVAVRDRTKVVTGEEFMMMERKIANKIMTRSGTYVIDHGMATFIQYGKNYVCRPGVSQVVSTSERVMSVLSSDYDIGSLNYFRVIVPFNPCFIRKAYSGLELKLVELVSCTEVNDRYYDAVFRVRQGEHDTLRNVEILDQEEVDAQEAILNTERKAPVIIHHKVKDARKNKDHQVSVYAAGTKKKKRHRPTRYK